MLHLSFCHAITVRFLFHSILSEIRKKFNKKNRSVFVFINTYCATKGVGTILYVYFMMNIIQPPFIMKGGISD